MSGITSVRKHTATTPLDAPVPRQAPRKTLVSTTMCSMLLTQLRISHRPRALLWGRRVHARPSQAQTLNFRGA